MTRVEQNESSPEQETLREAFVNKDILPVVGSGLTYQAFRKVDRRQFLPPSSQFLAYGDTIINLEEEGSSVSQPSLVAEMIHNLQLTGEEKVLEIGTGSGYEAALLSCCAKSVYTVEHHERLANQARERLENLGYTNVEVLCGDGALGWPEKAPFDAIIVSAGAKEIPNALAEQLAENGRIVIPVATPETTDYLNLVAGVKKPGEIEVKVIGHVRFHPLVSPHHGGWTREEVEMLKNLKPKPPQPKPTTDEEQEVPDEELEEFKQLINKIRQDVEQGQLPEEERQERLEYLRYLETLLELAKQVLTKNQNGESIVIPQK